MRKRILKLPQYPEKESKTYFQGRVCQFCGEPIEDQARKSKIHCSAWIDEFGVKHDCRRKKHQYKHQLEEDVLLDFSAKQREMARQLQKLLAAHGNQVSTEVLDAYGINLSACLGFSFEEGVFTTRFLGFTIATNLFTQQHLIQKS
ncbi:MAG: hypothetical protein ACK4RX_12810 [Chitinophagaceae bacterium]